MFAVTMRMCRICALESDDNDALFDERAADGLSEAGRMFHTCLAFELRPHDRLPRTLCFRCNTQLRMFNEFRRGALRMHEKFRIAVGEPDDERADKATAVAEASHGPDLNIESTYDDESDEDTEDAFPDAVRPMADDDGHIGELFDDDGTIATLGTDDRDADDGCADANSAPDVEAAAAEATDDDRPDDEDELMDEMYLDEETLDDDECDDDDELRTSDVGMAIELASLDDSRNAMLLLLDDDKEAPAASEIVVELASHPDEDVEFEVHEQIADESLPVGRKRGRPARAGRKPVAGKQPQRRGALARNRQATSDDEVVHEMVKCEICERQFVSELIMKMHICRTVHAKGLQTFSCDECGARFTTRQRRDKHCARHLPDRPVPCDRCDKRFKNKYDLRVHMMGHDGVKHYKCTQCGMAFRARSHLTNHVESHAVRNLLPCQYCKQKYKTQITLTRHIISMHTNKDEFGCEQCGKTFGLKFRYERHLKIHERERNDSAIAKLLPMDDVDVHSPSTA